MPHFSSMKTLFSGACSLLNQNSQNQKSKKRLQKNKCKALLTSSEMKKINKMHKQPIKTNTKETNTISNYQSSVKTTQESAQSNCERSNSLLKKEFKTANNNICESQKQLGTTLHLNKNKNIKKIKQVSIDLQNKIVIQKKIESKKKNETNPLIKSQDINNSKKNTNKKTSKNSTASRRSISVNTKQTSTFNSNNTNYTNNETSQVHPPSQIFSSISTFKTLFKINEKGKHKITSESQIKELEELNEKLNQIKNQQFNEENKKCIVLNAEMLEEDTNDKGNDKKDSKNEEIILNSHQRLQTYKLLLDCINAKFNEIQEIVEHDINNKLNPDSFYNNKVSELHSKIEFTQDHITNQDNNSKCITINPYDYEDDEMQERSNIIVPQGQAKTEPNNINPIINTNINEPTVSINSELLKTLGEFDENNLISFFSNEMISFFQPNNNSIITNNNTTLSIIQNQKDINMSVVNQLNQLKNNNAHNNIKYEHINNDNNNKCLTF